jgi:hypothetical protein
MAPFFTTHFTTPWQRLRRFDYLVNELKGNDYASGSISRLPKKRNTR